MLEIETEAGLLYDPFPTEAGKWSAPPRLSKTSIDEGTVLFYSANEIVLFETEEASIFFRVEFGTVRVSRATRNGRPRVSAFYFAGDEFGVHSANAFGFRAQCVDTVGLHIVRPNLTHFRDKTSLLLKQECLIDFTENFAAGKHQAAILKVADFLLELAARQRTLGTVDLVMPDEDVADYLGLAPAQVSAALKDLAARGKIRARHHRQIEIIDLAGATFQRAKP